MGRLSEGMFMIHCSADEWSKYAAQVDGDLVYLSRLKRDELKEMRKKYRKRTVKKR